MSAGSPPLACSRLFIHSHTHVMAKHKLHKHMTNISSSSSSSSSSSLTLSSSIENKHGGHASLFLLGARVSSFADPLVVHEYDRQHHVQQQEPHQHVEGPEVQKGLIWRNRSHCNQSIHSSLQHEVETIECMRIRIEIKIAQFNTKSQSQHVST